MSAHRESRVGAFIDRLQHRAYFRPCRDLNCQIDQGGHSHHFTRLGHWHYVGRFL